MATPAVATRPSQTLRIRRESQRPNVAQTRNTRNAMAETSGASKELPMPRSANDSKYILAKYANCEPSLSLELHDGYWRFKKQDGKWPYKSEMSFFLKHLRDSTMPHEMMDELIDNNVKFYDNHLIVEIYDFRTKSGKDADAEKTTNKKLFSIHEPNPFLTPSPYAPFSGTKRPATADGDGSPSKKAKLGEINSTKVAKQDDAEKENVPESGKKPATASKTGGPAPDKKPMRRVMFSTQLSIQIEIERLSRVPLKDYMSRRPSKTAGTPTMAQLPTPSTSVPPTPQAGFKGLMGVNQKMVVDQSNHLEFEAELVNKFAPPLILDPTHSFEESQAIIEATTDPLHRHPPPAPKARKRTSAELAADDARAEQERRYMTTGDESQAAANLRGGDSGEQAQFGSTAFARFNIIEDIKMAHQQQDRQKKEEEARQIATKRAEQDRQRLQQKELEQKKEQQRIMQEKRAAMMAAQQQQQAAELHKRQQQEQFQAAQEAAQNQANMMPNPQIQSFQQSQPTQGSPIIRQQTPMQSSPVMNGNMMSSQGGMAMMATSSAPGGSPARPPSAMQHNPMARQISQQHNQQNPSRTGTPIVQGTPVMNQAVPAQRMTPQPNAMRQQGSPGGMPIQIPPNWTPTPQQNASINSLQQTNGLTRDQAVEQLFRLQRARQMQAQRAMAAQQQGSPHGSQMSPDQLQQFQMMQQQRLAQQGQHGNPITPTPQQNQFQNPALRQQMAAQMASSGSPAQRITQAPTMNAQSTPQMNPSMSQQGGQPNQGQVQQPSNPQQLQAQLQAHVQRIRQMQGNVLLQHIAQVTGGNVPPDVQPQMQQQGGMQRLAQQYGLSQWPPQVQQQIAQQQRLAQRLREMQANAQGQGQQASVGNNMNMGNMNMGNMGNMNLANMGQQGGQSMTDPQQAQQQAMMRAMQVRNQQMARAAMQGRQAQQAQAAAQVQQQGGMAGMTPEQMRQMQAMLAQNQGMSGQMGNMGGMNMGGMGMNRMTSQQGMGNMGNMNMGNMGLNGQMGMQGWMGQGGGMQ